MYKLLNDFKNESNETFLPMNSHSISKVSFFSIASFMEYPDLTSVASILHNGPTRNEYLL